MNVEGLGGVNGIQSDPMGTSHEFRALMAAQSEQASGLMRLKLQNAHSLNLKNARQQLEMMHLHADRALSNERSTRALDEMFGKFSLIQKIMQSMG